jgi:hypothetical protein
MDFIEQIFGVSPDGGSGLLELLLFMLPILGLVVIWRVRSRGQTPQRRRRDG